jgi:hypothetical protein
VCWLESKPALAIGADLGYPRRPRKPEPHGSNQQNSRGSGYGARSDGVDEVPEPAEGRGGRPPTNGEHEARALFSKQRFGCRVEWVQWVKM